MVPVVRAGVALVADVGRIGGYDDVAEDVVVVVVDVVDEDIPVPNARAKFAANVCARCASADDVVVVVAVVEAVVDDEDDVAVDVEVLRGGNIAAVFNHNGGTRLPLVVDVEGVVVGAPNAKLGRDVVVFVVEVVVDVDDDDDDDGGGGGGPNMKLLKSIDIGVDAIVVVAVVDDVVDVDDDTVLAAAVACKSVAIALLDVVALVEVDGAVTAVDDDEVSDVVAAVVVVVDGPNAANVAANAAARDAASFDGRERSDCKTPPGFVSMTARTTAASRDATSNCIGAAELVVVVVVDDDDEATALVVVDDDDEATALVVGTDDDDDDNVTVVAVVVVVVRGGGDRERERRRRG